MFTEKQVENMKQDEDLQYMFTDVRHTKFENPAEENRRFAHFGNLHEGQLWMPHMMQSHGEAPGLSLRKKTRRRKQLDIMQNVEIEWYVLNAVLECHTKFNSAVMQYFQCENGDCVMNQFADKERVKWASLLNAAQNVKETVRSAATEYEFNGGNTWLEELLITSAMDHLCVLVAEMHTKTPKITEIDEKKE